MVTTLAEFPGLPAQLQNISSANAKDTFYPAKQHFETRLLQSATQWFKRNGFAADKFIEEFQEFLQQQWPLHLQHCSEHPTYSFKHVTQLRDHLRDRLIHCEDHAAQKFVVYCPRLYLDLVRDTFKTNEVFKSIPLPPTHVSSILFSCIPTGLRTRYKWGFKFDKPLAYSYILPKRKKNFTTAQPIISSPTRAWALFSRL